MGKKYIPKKRGIMKTCKECKKEFWDESGTRTVFCSDECRKISTKRRTNNNLKEYYGVNGHRKPDDAVCSECGDGHEVTLYMSTRYLCAKCKAVETRAYKRRIFNAFENGLWNFTVPSCLDTLKLNISKLENLDKYEAYKIGRAIDELNAYVFAKLTNSGPFKKD